MKRWIACSFLFALILLGALPGKAAGTPVPHGTVTLIADDPSLTPGHAFQLGLHFQLERGWHIYWRNPGDSGQPPRIDWTLPAGITAGELEWPAPERIGTSSIMDFGYSDAVTLLVPMRAAATLPTQQDAVIRGSLRVLVCREICMPGKAEVSISVPVKASVAEPDAQTRALFEAARKSLPQAAPGAWKFRAADTNDNFILHASVGRRVAQATFFPLEQSQIDNAAPQNVTPSAQGFEMTLKKSDQLLKPVAQLKGVLVLSTGQVYKIDVPVVNSGTAK